MFDEPLSVQNETRPDEEEHSENQKSGEHFPDVRESDRFVLDDERGNGQNERGENVFEDEERQYELFHIFMFLRMSLEKFRRNRRTRRIEDGTDQKCL